MTTFRTIAITSAAVLGYCLAVAFGPAFLFGSGSVLGEERPSVEAHASPASILSSLGERSDASAFCWDCVEAASR